MLSKKISSELLFYRNNNFIQQKIASCYPFPFHQLKMRRNAVDSVLLTLLKNFSLFIPRPISQKLHFFLINEATKIRNQVVRTFSMISRCRFISMAKGGQFKTTQFFQLSRSLYYLSSRACSIAASSFAVVEQFQNNDTFCGRHTDFTINALAIYRKSQ